MVQLHVEIVQESSASQIVRVQAFNWSNDRALVKTDRYSDESDKNETSPYQNEKQEKKKTHRIKSCRLGKRVMKRERITGL